MKRLIDEWGRPFKACDNPLCDRQTPQGVMYCCGECDWSHKAVESGMKPFDPHHSKSCDDRWEKRRHQQ